MSLRVASGSHLPNLGCDVRRNLVGGVDGVTNGRKVEKFASTKGIDGDVNRCVETAFAGSRMGEDDVRHLFTGTDAISYECVGSADRFVARRRNATALAAVGVSLGHDLGRQPAVPAVTILEGPENGH